MTELTDSISDLERKKFRKEDDEIVVAVTGKTLSQQTGLSVKGRHTEVLIDDSSWTPLPMVQLASANVISIQNYTGFQMKVNFIDDVMLGVGYVGTRIADKSERMYDISNGIQPYGRLAPGSGSAFVDVEELA